MKRRERQLNSRPYNADYVAFELERNSDGEITKATPWFALQDVDDSNKHDVLMYSPSAVGDETRVFNTEDLSCQGSVSDFYEYMTDSAGISSNRMMNIVFGDYLVNEYDESFRKIFDAACCYYAEHRLELQAEYDEYTSRFEECVIGLIPEEQMKVSEPATKVETEVEVGVEETESVPEVQAEKPKKSREADLPVITESPDSTEDYPKMD